MSGFETCFLRVDQVVSSEKLLTLTNGWNTDNVPELFQLILRTPWIYYINTSLSYNLGVDMGCNIQSTICFFWLYIYIYVWMYLLYSVSRFGLPFNWRKPWPINTKERLNLHGICQQPPKKVIKVWLRQKYPKMRNCKRQTTLTNTSHNSVWVWVFSYHHPLRWMTWICFLFSCFFWNPVRCML